VLKHVQTYNLVINNCVDLDTTEGVATGPLAVPVINVVCTINGAGGVALTMADPEVNSADCWTSGAGGEDAKASGDEVRDARMVWGTRMPGGVASGTEGRRVVWMSRGGGGAADVRMAEVLDD
jgi:hypothetical protein